MLLNTKNHYTEMNSTEQAYFANYYSDSHKPWFYNRDIPRELIVFIHRSRLNHYNLATSLARVNIIENQNYQTLDRIVMECSMFTNQRK